MSKRYPGGIIRKTPQTPSQTSAQGIWDMASVTQAVKENTWPIAGVPDPISKSLRFRSSASAYMNRTFTSSGNTQKFTQSIWCKRGTLGAFQTIGYTFFTGTYNGQMRFNSNDTLDIYVYYDGSSYTGQLSTTQVFRDPSAWYHFVLAVDTTQATASNRIKFYVNGVQVTAFGTANYPNQNQALVWNASGNTGYFINAQQGNQNFFGGYITELNYIDGQALTPSSFGNTNDQTGVWQPIAYTGTYGTNGFYLPFSNTASTTTLGYDYSGNSNNWTTNNISLTTGTAIQSFTNTGTTSWTAPTGVTSVNYLVVAGGGSGGSNHGAGGGAGGMLTGTLTVVPGTSYTVTVGAGGAATAYGSAGNNGGNSVFGSITSTGGGAGGSSSSGGGSNGGSGGGATAFSPYNLYGTGIPGQGNNGGTSSSNETTHREAGGGGGAGAVGGNSNLSTGAAGNGGAGLASSISGSSVTYAGGGGGGCSAGFTTGTGGSGGGGNGANGSSNGGNGTANTGGGGGGGGGVSPATGGNGGSGIVILSWTSGTTSTYDSMNDVPTQWIPYNTTGDTGGLFRGNYAVMNPLIQTSNLTLSNGNLTITGTGSYSTSPATFGMSSGKWYWEYTCTTYSASGDTHYGIGTSAFNIYQNTWIGSTSAGWIYAASNGNKYNNNSAVAYGTTFTSGDIIGVAFDADVGTLTFYKNGTTQGTAYTGLTSGPYFPVATVGTSNLTNANFGQRPFVYTPPAGFKTLCTTNLSTPTIGATASTTANKYMDATLYTGAGNVSTSITNAGGFQPDFVWTKARSIGYNHYLYDSVRGTGTGASLYSDNTNAEGTFSSNGNLSSFNSNGWTIGTTAGTNALNASGQTFVGWQWRASNATAVTNTAGSITSTVSANTTAGFSIVTYTGNGTSGATVGHGLGVTPSMVILKQRDGASNWQVKHVSLNANQNLILNSTAAVDTAPGSGYISAISSTTLTLLNGGSAITNVNANNGTYVAYCFAQVAGYSAFGSYTGNGSSDGPFIFTGFRPRFIMIKQSSSSNYWWLKDSARSPTNQADLRLAPNLSDAESNDAAFNGADFLSNGFKLRGTDTTTNQSGGTYIYVAFAENPFKYALAR